MIITGSTLSKLTYSPNDFTCTGEYHIETYTVGACSTGGVMYQIVPGTASLVPSLAPTAFSSALTLELSGYSVTAHYSDDRCTLLRSAVSYPLNSCTEYRSQHVKYTATAYSIARTEYSDSSCKTATSALGAVYIDHSVLCAPLDFNFGSFWTQPGLAIVNANGVPPSSLAMASIRLVRVTCITASLPCSLPCRCTLPCPCPVLCLLTSHCL